MKASDWISAEDRFPKDAEYVLVCREQDGQRWVSLAAYVRINDAGSFWYDCAGFDIHDVTHWQKIVLPKNK